MLGGMGRKVERRAYNVIRIDIDPEQHSHQEAIQAQPVDAST